MPIDVVDLSDGKERQLCSSEVKSMLLSWATRPNLKTSTALAALVAAAVQVAKAAGIKRGTLIRAMRAAWGNTTEDDDE